MNNSHRLRMGILLLLLAATVLMTMAPVCAQNAAGEVQYAARFGDYTDLRDTGVQFGTASGKGSSLRLDSGELHIASAGGEKTYLLLPPPESWTDTYTVEYTFRFTDIAASKGYCGFLLSSRGDAPSSRTELILRADGTLDEYTAAPSEALQEAARAGKAITVRVVVRYNFLFSVTVLCDGQALGVYTPSLLRSISAGNRGFVLRNASVALSSVVVINGSEYEALSGAYAEKSYMAPPDWVMPTLPSAPPAPPTGEHSFLIPLGFALISAWTGTVLRRRRA